jgi:two-component system, NarL family, sensor kinase
VRRRYASAERPIVLRGVAVAVIVILAAFTSEREDWEHVGLLLTLGLATVVADSASVGVRSVRLSVGLMVQTTTMALLGPAPAVLIAFVSTLIDARVNRVSLAATMNNLLPFSLLNLVGGVLFELLRDWFDLSVNDTGYALLVLPVYLLLDAGNLAMVTLAHPELPRGSRLRVIWESGVPAFPLEFINGLLAATIVLAWGNAGLVVAAPLVIILVVVIPLSRTVADALSRSDDLLALRAVSDERAAEVARLASDRERLLTEVVAAESRERARLAESLHDGPMQRLMAARQDAAADRRDTSQLDEAIAETRAIISAFHPAAVRELGFEASVRSAVAPFPAARAIGLTIHVGPDDQALADTLLLRVAQELVVNAVKHAAPSRIDVLVREDAGRLVLEINDDGIGIDTERADRAVQAGHVGLAIVRRRVEDAGGEFSITTRPDGGTRSSVALPA